MFGCLVQGKTGRNHNLRFLPVVKLLKIAYFKFNGYWLGRSNPELPIKAPEGLSPEGSGLHAILHEKPWYTERIHLRSTGILSLDLTKDPNINGT